MDAAELSNTARPAPRGAPGGAPGGAPQSVLESAPHGARERLRSWLRVALALVYVTAGLFHLAATDAFVLIVPAWVPAPHATVIATGLCELAGAAALLTHRLRRLAGIMLALYAVCVYPANIKHALDHVAIGGRALGWGYHAPRLAFQPVLVWWALFSGKVTNWPFRRSQQR